MNVSRHALSLAAGVVLGAAILSLSAGQAEAMPRRPDNGVRCATHNPGTNEWDFYMPGEKLCSIVSKKCMVCGNDGQWHTVAYLTGGDSQTADGGVLAP
jgi:hypothetical protein